MRLNRTLAVGLLMAAAVSVPCTAWWIGGHRAIDQKAAELVATPERQARRVASRFAERLHGRLETIRDVESRRPYYEYRNRFPDLSDECSCAPIIDSPLSRGSDELLIWTHFEIDRTGAITIPTVGEEDADSPRYELAVFDPHEILAGLRSDDTDLTTPVWGGARPPPPDFDETDAVVAAAEVVVYGDTEALVEPLRWYTAKVMGRPTLVAMRKVRAPDGRRIQGFVVLPRFLDGALPDTEFDTETRAAAEDDGAIAEDIDLPGTTWQVVVHVEEAIAAARKEAEGLRSRFHRLFLGGTAAALLASVLVVGLVGQTERLARQRSRFAASAAHELRTPLAGLRVYGEMLAESLGDANRTREYARQVAAEAERLGRVVSNVLGYTRLERGSISVKPEPGDLATVLREGAERLRFPVEAAGASLQVDVPETLPGVRFDRDAVFQIVQNLVDNAERYGRDGADRTISVRARAGRDEVRVEVVDRGPGVSGNARSSLFRPFARGDAVDAPAGLGLGLAIVRSLAEAHGGAVRHEPNPEGGSIFRVTFPIARPAVR